MTPQLYNAASRDGHQSSLCWARLSFPAQDWCQNPGCALHHLALGSRPIAKISFDLNVLFASRKGDVEGDRRSIDETMAIEDGDCVMMPKGYHPVGAPHGYDLYYLNVMASPNRKWVFKNESAHEWIVKQPK